MSKRWVANIALAAAVVLPAVAHAQETGVREFEPEEEFDHEGQFDVNLQFGLGYRGIFTYNEEFCGELKDDGSGENRPNCLGRSPFALDLAFGYGLRDKLEVFLQARIGIETDFGQ